jgi:EAL domain-containing protein (putative c-di-GMP-specific phosphodiesterase class I)
MELTLKRSSLLAQKLAVIDKDKALDVHYQPIVNVMTNEIVSYEALIRWNDEELGYVNPEELIRIAEETGLICSVENWVLHKAAKSLKVLRKLTHPNVTMSVNISGLHFSAANFEKNILNILKTHKLQPSDLVIELTESVLLTDIASQSSPVKSLKRSEIQLSIDDFGTGFSSLAYLHNIPATTVKVDKSFLDNMFLDNMELNTITLECIHTLIEALKMDSLIEGVETKRQMDVLSSLGYHLQQGYYHGKPKPLEYYIESAGTST